MVFGLYAAEWHLVTAVITCIELNGKKQEPMKFKTRESWRIFRFPAKFDTLFILTGIHL